MIQFAKYLPGTFSITRVKFLKPPAYKRILAGYAPAAGQDFQFNFGLNEMGILNLYFKYYRSSAGMSFLIAENGRMPLRDYILCNALEKI